MSLPPTAGGAFQTVMNPSMGSMAAPGSMPPTGPMASMDGGPPSQQYQTMLPSNLPQPARTPFETLPPGSMTPGGMALGSVSPMGSMMGAPPLPDAASIHVGRECTVIISKLLDVPVDRALFGGVKSYIISILDHNKKEIAQSHEIEGVTEERADGHTETFGVPPEVGTLRVRTNHRLFYVQVEHSGGVLTGDVIGVCQIHRQDPRSSQPWAYVLSQGNRPANCGIELCVVESLTDAMNSMSGMASFAGKTGPMASLGYQGPMDTMGSAVQPGSLSPHTPGGSMGPGASRLGPLASQGALSALGYADKPSLPALDGELDDVQHGVSCMLEFEGAKDMPCPRTAQMRDVMITVMTDAGKELRKIGLFPTQQQIGSRLASVDCRQTRVFVQAPLHFGGDAQEGAQYIKIAVSYGKKSGKTVHTELVGITNPIKVSWKPVTKQYQAIHNPESRAVLGGIYLSHRLVSELEAAGQRKQGHSSLKVASQQQAIVAAPVEPEQRISGRTGHFPYGSQEEAFEQAAINAEAQNRALLQRCKKEDPRSHMNEVRTVNGWREWDSLDEVFRTMGPNPLTMSEELGAQVARSYQHTTSVAKEVGARLGPASTPADQILNVEMLRMYTKEDPTKVSATVRPVVCKNPQEIADPRDMTWCPDPPIYAPLDHMTEHDKETVRLACYDPSQNAALVFADVNPNYNIREDIWGVFADEKKAQSGRMAYMSMHQARVKDDCLMA
eukprot:TRINITY_DN5964_c0_g1_i1.p1 TRINITY_DN5964_c0_g1~~TRINITY_DN5964_c0_g1_i1.p1  ORF type:complete len:728 (+),score=130.12 TRINITY_DN5964_c0_g1_i1:202-2385(+)